MNDAPRRRLTDRTQNSPTLIGGGATFTGQLHCNGDLMVAGTVEGEAKVGGALTIADTGQWRGEVVTSSAVIAGEVHGDLTVENRLEIRKSARIRGSIRAKSIAIATGAIIDGDMSVTSNAPVMHFEEKRET